MLGGIGGGLAARVVSAGPEDAEGLIGSEARGGWGTAALGRGECADPREPGEGRGGGQAGTGVRTCPLRQVLSSAHARLALVRARGLEQAGSASACMPRRSAPQHLDRLSVAPSLSRPFPLCFFCISSVFPLCFLFVSSLFPLLFLLLFPFLHAFRARLSGQGEAKEAHASAEAMRKFGWLLYTKRSKRAQVAPLPPPIVLFSCDVSRAVYRPRVLRDLDRTGGCSPPL